MKVDSSNEWPFEILLLSYNIKQNLAQLSLIATSTMWESSSLI